MISLLQLEYFLVLAEEQHTTRAAEKLFVSQSTLSTMISKLEKELGVSLFDRQNNRIYLNDQGRLYYKHIKLAMAEIKRAEQAVRRTKQAKLSISSSQEEVWQDVVLNFKEQHPECYIEQYAGSQSRFLELLLTGTVDFVLTGTGSIGSPKVDSQQIEDLGLCLAVHKNHPLAEREAVKLAEIQEEPYIELSKDNPFRCYTDSLCERAKISLNRVIECDHSLKRKMLSMGKGISLIVDAERIKAMYQNVVFIPVSDELARRRISVYWLRDRKLTPMMEEFLSSLSK